MKPVYLLSSLVLVGSAANTGSSEVKRCDDNSTKQGNWCQCNAGYTMPINPDYNKPFGGWSYRYHRNAIGKDGFVCIAKEPGNPEPEPNNPEPQPELKCYIGCYRDDRERDMEKRVHDNSTVDQCRVECARQKYKYFSVQYGKQCFCGNNYATKDIYKKLEDSACKRKGYPVGHGGAWANSVYKTECNEPMPTPTPTPEPMPTPTPTPEPSPMPAPTPEPAPKPDCTERTKIRGEVGPDTKDAFLQCRGEFCKERGYTSGYIWWEPFATGPSGCECRRGSGPPCPKVPTPAPTFDPSCEPVELEVFAGFSEAQAKNWCVMICKAKDYTDGLPWMLPNTTSPNGCVCQKCDGDDVDGEPTTPAVSEGSGKLSAELQAPRGSFSGSG